MPIDIQKIAILGSGITAAAVTEKALALGLSIVSPELADVVVTSPGIPPRDFPNVSCEIIAEVEFAYRYLMASQAPPTIVGITGTNGKSTVTAMVAHLLGCPVAGNIGIPLVTYIPMPGESPPPFLAVELSSYQLETCRNFRPHIAIVLGLTPDHVDRHPTMADYAAAKQRLVANQTAEDLLIYDADNVWSAQIASTSLAQKTPLSADHPLFKKIEAMVNQNRIPTQCLGLIGRHNLMNALAAGLVASECGLSDDRILERLADYVPLPHRIEYVGTVKGCRVFNDSKATNPESTLVAMAAFEAPIHVLLGGKDKGLALGSFVSHIAQKAASITVFGEIADRMYGCFHALSDLPPLTSVTTLEEALSVAIQQALPGSVILFSPACSSFDQFKNFEHRGDVFRQLVVSAMADAPHA